MILKKQTSRPFGGGMFCLKVEIVYRMVTTPAVYNRNWL